MKAILKLSMALALSATNFLSAQQWQSTGSVVAGGNGYGNNADQFKQLMSVTADSQGNIYVPDLGNHRIQKWTPGATQGTTIIGGIGQSNTPEGLNLPVGVLYEPDGTIFISDAGNSRIQMWLPGATQGITVAGGNGSGSGLHQLNWQGGIFKKGNDLYIVDSGNFRVLKWTIGATAGVVVAGGNGFGASLNQLGTPSLNGNVYVDNNDNIYVTEYSNARVTKWSPGATSGTVVAGNSSGQILYNPVGISVMSDGKILISDYSNSSWRVTLWQDGNFISDVVSKASNELKQPTGIFLDSNKNLYVANYGDNSVKKFNYIGNLSTNEISTLKIQIYPNPVQDIMNIKAEKQIEDITVTDHSGKLVKKLTAKTSTAQISLKALPQGTYYVTADIDQRRYVQKVIKK